MRFNNRYVKEMFNHDNHKNKVFDPTVAVNDVGMDPLTAFVYASIKTGILNHEASWDWKTNHYDMIMSINQINTSKYVLSIHYTQKHYSSGTREVLANFNELLSSYLIDFTNKTSVIIDHETDAPIRSLRYRKILDWISHIDLYHKVEYEIYRNINPKYLAKNDGGWGIPIQKVYPENVIDKYPLFKNGKAKLELVPYENTYQLRLLGNEEPLLESVQLEKYTRAKYYEFYLYLGVYDCPCIYVINNKKHEIDYIYTFLNFMEEKKL